MLHEAADEVTDLDLDSEGMLGGLHLVHIPTANATASVGMSTCEGAFRRCTVRIPAS